MALNTAAMVARRRFGQALKEARSAAGVVQADATRAIGRKTVDRISQIERGMSWPKGEELDTLAELYGLDAVQCMRLATMLHEGQAIKGTWWTQYEDEFPESLMQFIAYEDAAQRIVTCAGSLIPGILQTAEYARSISEAILKTYASTGFLDRSVEIRAKRRQIITRKQPPLLEIILGEGAVRQQVGGASVMMRQLDSLIADGQRRNVSIRVIPMDARATVAYMFTSFEFSGADEKPVVAFDAMNGLSFRKKSGDVRSIRGYLNAMREISASPLDSLDLLRAIRKELDSA
ncbi:hypothetical protein AF335_28965 [Streptomyces eurocidicus]|uniref:Transcriptional regulator with XRE-family HTH domain n=1 Tax=Streptomyces eurocidicus TaxID=66423 RepID=A0A2N8NNH6_STREU|nr:helix-turn-helix transcriptional regulator [Streptomyces eurocidicus]MBB5123090.1 transcriptional regulator with XRE-family HTH domain [Streptomyces eurocidicus]MBF6056162.1 helix-turn-helix domain-containing protein [Streptomyces eurocidicus]PNE30315.1 hypothetical protein AF335_28965 [Streptomyces eurocidicus]